MDIKSIKQLIKIFENSTISNLEVEEEGLKVKISKTTPTNNTPQSHQFQMPITPTQSLIPQEVPIHQDITEPTPTVLEKADYYEVKSPMVGTFYRTPAPDAEAYVEIGTKVKAGQTLCIIEAMKLMNEIESEVSGIIKDIIVENANPVEYNQTLFLIDTS